MVLSDLIHYYDKRMTRKNKKIYVKPKYAGGYPIDGATQFLAKGSKKSEYSDDHAD